MPLTLSSQRLLLRDVMLEDWPAVQAYASRPEVYRFQPWGPNTPAEAQAYVAFVQEQAQQQPRLNYTLAIVLPSTTTVIGTCGIVIHQHQFRCGEIAYFFHPDYWGHAYATEVAHQLLRFGFLTLGLHRIIGTCDPRNMASARVLEKIGMRYEGCHREVMLLRDGWRDSLIYSILEDEWRMSANV